MQNNNLDRVRTLREECFKIVDYTPHEGQRRFHESLARFKVMIAGSRYGKSLAAAREVMPWLLIENSRGWIVGPSYRLAEKEFRYLAADAEKLFAEQADKLKIRRGGAHGPSSIIAPTGAEALTLSAADPTNLLGEELDWLILAEGAWLSEQVWTRALRARLTTRNGVMVLPTTPAGFNWVHQMWLRGLDPEHRDWDSFQFATAENRFIPPEEIEEAKRSLPEHIFAEQYLGQFVRPSGLVYPEFDPDVHVCETSKLEGLDQGQQIGGLDFGYRSPFVLLLASVTGINQLVVRRELRRTNKTLSEMEPLMSEAGAKALDYIYCDPSGGGMVRDLANRGFNARPANNAVSYGIERIRRRLLLNASGLPGLLIDHSCTGLIREFSEYSWCLGETGPEMRVQNEDREPKPEKANDHALDALRYICLALPDGAVGARWKRQPRHGGSSGRSGTGLE